MKPIYFPFTYMPESVAESLSRFLGRIMVFQPVANNQPQALRRLEENGLIDIRVPYAEDEDRLFGCLKEYKEWGQLHHGEETSLKDIFKNGFSNKTFTSQIRTDILKNQTDDSFAPDPVFLSRLFLLMAQELDLQQSAIDQDLASSIDDELDLFTSMTGEEKVLDPPKESLFKKDYGEYMTGSRIAAWFQLIKNTVHESAFLVTSSQSVLDEILETVTGLEKVVGIDGISCDQPKAVIKEFVQCLTNLTQTPWIGPDQIRLPDFNFQGGRKLNFKLYILPEADPVDICSFFSKDNISSKRNENSPLNTVIGFFEI